MVWCREGLCRIWGLTPRVMASLLVSMGKMYLPISSISIQRKTTEEGPFWYQERALSILSPWRIRAWMRWKYHCPVVFHFLRRIHCTAFLFIGLLFIPVITNRGCILMRMITTWVSIRPYPGVINGMKGRRRPNGFFSMVMCFHVADCVVCYR